MGIGWAEGILLVLLAALFLRGDEFASAARTLGRWMGQAQKMSRSFMEELQREARDTGLDDSFRQIGKALQRTSSATQGRPLDRLISELEGPEEAREDPSAPGARFESTPSPPPSKPAE